MADSASTDHDRERWRHYLLLLAHVQLGPPRRGKPGASDLVQQSLFDACRAKDQFRGQGDAERAGWLRRILACNLADDRQITAR